MTDFEPGEELYVVATDSELGPGLHPRLVYFVEDAASLDGNPRIRYPEGFDPWHMLLRGIYKSEDDASDFIRRRKAARGES